MENDVAAVEIMNEDSKMDITTITYEELKEATKDFSKELGKGGFGNVYKGNFGGREVAVKMLLAPDDEYQIKAFHREVSILSRLHHEHLVHLIGACPEKFALVYEYMPGGTLEDRLKDLPWNGRLRIAAEICAALMFLHSAVPELVVHGDVKPENILLDSNGTSKLADFGISRLILVTNTTTTIHHTTTNVQGSPGYLDPAFVQSSRLAPSADVYSFGMVLLRLLTNRQVGIELIHIVQEAVEKGCLEDLLDVVADWHKETAKELSDIAIRCCDTRVKNRPNLIEVYETLLSLKWLHLELSQQMRMGHVILFSYSSLEKATSSFHDDSKLGEVNTHNIYRGDLDGAEFVVAKFMVKRLFDKQIEVLNRFKHPHIVPLLGKCTKQMLVVYGCVARGTLHDRLLDHEHDFPWKDRLRIAAEICSALVFLHSQKPHILVCNRVHPSSVLLDATGKSMLFDFGNSERIRQSDEKPHQSRAADIGSFGMLLLICLLVRHTKFAGPITIEFVIAKVQKDHWEDLLNDAADWPQQLAKRLFRLVVSCSIRTEEVRPSAAEILELLEQMEEEYKYISN